MYFSQNGQDRFLDQEIFRGYRRGVFVEVGAWDGVDLSNTVFFERERGWTGLAIEPLPDRYQQLVAQRTCDALNVAVSDVDGEAEFLSISGPTSMLSGLVSTYHPRHVVRIDKEAAELGATKTTLRVPTRRLESIFREKGLTRIHYLSIDVEGAEFECLRSIDFNAVYIDVIGFEDNYPETTAPILEYLKARGYTILRRSPGECFMIRTGSPFTPRPLSLFKLR